MTESTSPAPEHARRSYVSVVVFLLVAALFGASISLAGGMRLYNKVLLDIGVAQVIAAGILLGVLARCVERQRPAVPPVEPAPAVTIDAKASTAEVGESVPSEEVPSEPVAYRDRWIVKLRPWREMRER